jgi:uncharacterized protein
MVCDGLYIYYLRSNFIFTKPSDLLRFTKFPQQKNLMNVMEVSNHMKSHILTRRSNFDLPGVIKFTLLILTFIGIAIAIPISIGIAADEASSPGFNCRKDTLTPVEKIICSDPELANLDAEMSKLFEAAKKTLPDKEKQDYFVDQRRWLRQRDISCNIKKDALVAQALEEKKTCLKNLYHGRINDLKTSKDDEWGVVLNEFANRIRTANSKSGELDLSNLFFSKSSKIQTASGELEEFGTGEEVIKTIKKQYVLAKSQIAEISKFVKNANGVSLYLEDVDQDGIKDVIINTTGGTLICNRYLFYHANSDKTLTRMKGPDTSQYENEGAVCGENTLGFVHLNKKTYIAVPNSSWLADAAEPPKTIIELFSMKSERSRKGIGKVQINYSSHFAGKFLKGNIPAFHLLEQKADSLVRHFSQQDSPPLATSLMNNPAWTYKGTDAEKISKLLHEEYYTDNFLKNDSRYQLLDIDNDGKKEIVCHLVYKGDEKKYSRMIIVKMGHSAPLSYVEVDKHFPQLGFIDKLLGVSYSYTEFGKPEYKGSEYFPLSDGKEYYIVKIGNAYFGWRESPGYILGIYKLKGEKIELVDAMSIEPQFTFKDVTVLK